VTKLMCRGRLGWAGQMLDPVVRVAGLGEYQAGQTYEVDREVATALLQRSPGAFVAVGGILAAPSNTGLTEGNVVRLPPPPAGLLDVLDQSIPQLVKALASGRLDPWLAWLVAAEEAGKTRKGALEVLRARMVSRG